MAIFDSYGNGFNPNMIQTQVPQQRMMVPNPPQIQPIGLQRSRELEKVNGIESAKQYPMQPNSMVALFDLNDDVFYIKQTDASNFPIIRIFRFHEEFNQSQVAPVEEKKYVTMDEFEKFKEEILNGQQSIRKQSDFDGDNTDAKYAKSKKYDANV